MVVPLLLILIWAAVLVPPALRAQAQRRADFLVSFDRSPGSPPPPTPGRSVRTAPVVTCAQRRRQIIGGLLVAIVATLVAGLLPPLRVLLVVHLFLVDSLLAYVAALVHLRRRQDAAPVVVQEPLVVRAGRSLGSVRRVRLRELPPLAGAWPE